ncbi:hypothetical protein F3Y22_tig00110893pilonHSYRG00506 [Hibiscus syriacus]|uniref:RNase H type-1 domain-containing protein n=1 Tax=Hibiscus syriacus TaxID=106335 RepID=A0A6A2ZFG5_HIBSY|nr:hypothetical protein F3Y22_tig00110893pilonHSYRG00506 [Hibiscus syriacus]
MKGGKTWGQHKGRWQRWGKLVHMAELHPSNFVDNTGRWNFSKLAELVNPEALAYIASVKPPDPHDSDDRPVWRWSSDHHFHVRSAYVKLLESDRGDVDSTWKRIWTIKLPQRLRFFLWLILKEKVMTNFERSKRMLTDNPSCPACNCPSETILHVLRDCPYARMVWDWFIPSSIAAIWQIWKQRNEYIFHGIARRQKPIVEDKGWTKPPSGWYCLNTDGAMTTVNGAEKIGGVIRNHDGGWEICFSRNIASSTVLQAELWGIYEGLFLAKSIGCAKLNIQSDSSQAIPPMEVADIVILEANAAHS